MSSELDELYRDVILDHFRSPRGARPLPRPTIVEEGYNPLCGDEVILELEVEEGRLKDVAVRSRGCSISVASGSFLAQELRGKPLSEIVRIAAHFKSMLQGTEEPDEALLGDLAALQGARKFPVRIKCALLPWTTLEQALRRLGNS